jgi:hypothetical protein
MATKKTVVKKKPLPPPPPKPFDATKDLDDTAPHETVGLQAALDAVVVELDKKTKEVRFLEGERDSARADADRLRIALADHVREIEALKDALRATRDSKKPLSNERIAQLEAFIRKCVTNGFNYSEAGEVLKP